MMIMATKVLEELDANKTPSSFTRGAQHPPTQAHLSIMCPYSGSDSKSQIHIWSSEKREEPSQVPDRSQGSQRCKVPVFPTF